MSCYEFEFLRGTSKMRRAVVRYLRLLPLSECSECSLQSQHRLDCRFEPRHFGTNLVGDFRNADLEEKTSQLSHSLLIITSYLTTVYDSSRSSGEIFGIC